MFIEIDDILINVNNITKIYYRIYDSEPTETRFVICIHTNDGSITKLTFKNKEKFESKWEWLRDIVP